MSFSPERMCMNHFKIETDTVLFLMLLFFFVFFITQIYYTEKRKVVKLICRLSSFEVISSYVKNDNGMVGGSVCVHLCVNHTKPQFVYIFTCTYRVLLSIMEDKPCNFTFLQQMVFRYEIDQPLLDLDEVGLLPTTKFTILQILIVDISIVDISITL